MAQFVGAEIIPKAVKGGFAQAAMGFLVGNRTPETLKPIFEQPMMKQMGIVTEAGDVDIDLLYNMCKAGFKAEDTYTVDLPYPLGRLKLDASDLDKIYQSLGGQDAQVSV